ncbi:hypothetical protein D8B29_19100, partial [Verminephrobacter eiseniae]|nr:hypothetical protein [Verminephrobacter eiseniae]
MDPWAAAAHPPQRGGASGSAKTVAPGVPASSVASPIICRSALAIEAHRGVASLANTLGIG